MHILSMTLFLSQILVNVLMAKYDLLMESLNKKEDLRSVSMAYGVQYVIHHGVLLMVMSSVILWDMMVQVCHVYYRAQTQYINYDKNHSIRSSNEGCIHNINPCIVETTNNNLAVHCGFTQFGGNLAMNMLWVSNLNTTTQQSYPLSMDVALFVRIQAI